MNAEQSEATARAVTFGVQHGTRFADVAGRSRTRGGNWREMPGIAASDTNSHCWDMRAKWQVRSPRAVTAGRSIDRLIDLELIARANATTRVYFVRSGEAGPIKIGWAVSVRKRLALLQTGNPETLRVLAVAPGDAELEALLHLRFDALRVRGEWFRPGPELLATAQRMANRYGRGER